jgi:aspartate aminotransferase
MKIYQERMELLYDHLTNLGFEAVKPSGAFYIFPKSPMEDEKDFVKKAAKYNILVVPGSGFGCPGYFRLAFCVDMKIIKNSLPAFTKLAQELNLK